MTSTSALPIILMGAGERGAQTFASYALRRPEDLCVVGVAESDPAQRRDFAAQHQIPAKRCFPTWQDCLDAPRLAEVALIALPVQWRAEAAAAALAAGYHVVLQPPMGLSPQECGALMRAQRAGDSALIMAHGLRYTAFYRALHDTLAAGKLGQIHTYRQERSIANWHLAHAWLRGRSLASYSNPMLFSEGLHELDLMLWLLKDPLESLSSEGQVRHFDRQTAPAPYLPTRCVDSCPIEADCYFSAKGLYAEKRLPGQPQKGWPHRMIAEGDESPEALQNAILKTRWGQCVYHLNTSLVDYQQMTMQSRSGIEVHLSLNAGAPLDQRIIRIEGSLGHLEADFIGLDSFIRLQVEGREQRMNFRLGPYSHGGEHGLMGSLNRILARPADWQLALENSFQAHLLAFVAEEARQSGKTLRFEKTP
jgi:hypothetical protein